ncbi:hypothetical protein BV25DRAFT_1797181 [Artomyces pyxidatus]|uniref:Uncharacterized protein n=1 Tax=Artomyces pyxidatus TaxID=48021 RepID=A0ACB8TCM1_9AGAM|nr:hypothetical protein BV25DRAFT_1797181 [Artomyces pyxidatus]
MGLLPSFSDISKPLPPSPATDQQRYAENEKKLKGLHFKKRNSREPPEVVSSSIPGQAPVRSTKDISIGRLVSSNVDLRPVSQKILDVWDDWTCKASGEVDEDAPFAADGESKGEAFNGLCLASEDIVHDTPAVPKPCRPRLQNKPVIWAKSRQEVCETLECFRSYQGGVYHIHDLAKGYLLSAFSSNRDVFEHNGKLIISHGGGKAEALHSTKGRSETHAAADQLEGDQSVRALLNTFKANRPLVLLADDKYALFPFDLAAGEYTYVVLGLYRITHAWAELQPAQTNIGRVVRYKFAFQWCEEEDPWWFREKETPAALASGIDNNPLGMNAPIELSDTSSSYPPECGRCQQAFPQVYQDAWMCLNPKCAEFFKVNGEERVLDNLTYASEFLALQPRNIPEVRQSARPPPPPQSNHGIVTTKRFSRGLHCQECGRLSSRYKWEHWECKSCGEIYEVNGQVRSAKDFWYQLEGIPYLQSRIDPRSGNIPLNKAALLFQPHGRSSSLTICEQPLLVSPRSVHIIPGGALINREADAIFRKYQEQASAGEIQFRRWPLRNSNRIHIGRGELLTNYFSQNTGAPYQYVGGADQTVPLETGPSAVRDALALIQKRIEMTLHRHEPFNEVLSAAYMEKQRMAFHSDSEKGLGPVVASLSLGSIAYMHFRLHSQYCREEGSRKVALSLLLRHGDILVMDGAGIQKFYEHTVVPMNFRIVATARNISPENHMA